MKAKVLRIIGRLLGREYVWITHAPTGMRHIERVVYRDGKPGWLYTPNVWISLHSGLFPWEPL